MLLSLLLLFFCSTFGIVQLAKFEGGVLKTSGDIASTSHEFYRSVFLGEGGEDEKVNKEIKILKNVDGTVNLFAIRLICCFKGSS